MELYSVFFSNCHRGLFDSKETCVSIKWMVIINMNWSLIIMTMSATEQHRVQSSRALPEISLQSSVARTPVCSWVVWPGPVSGSSYTELHQFSPPPPPLTQSTVQLLTLTTQHMQWPPASSSASTAPAWPLSKLEYKCLHCCRIFPVALTSGYRR